MFRGDGIVSQRKVGHETGKMLIWIGGFKNNRHLSRLTNFQLARFFKQKTKTNKKPKSQTITMLNLSSPRICPQKGSRGVCHGRVGQTFLYMLEVFVYCKFLFIVSFYFCLL
eukprot:Lithocolla_globosa_v1_NODE_721_length_3385_cov_11.766967.p4 type:complete len:112 gc:universal NODE_721_length_3385_cov_11.766967:808-473(-)